GPVTGRPVLLTSFAEYQRRFGGYLSDLEYGPYRFLPNAVEQFFTNGGSTCYVMRAAPEDAACAKSADGPVTVRAKDPGAWANTMQVFFTRSTRARTQILDTQEGVSGRQYVLKNAAGFRVGDLVVYRGEDGSAAYHKVTALNGMLISFQEELPGDAVDTGLVPTRTLEACGVDMVIRCGGQEESYPGCSLNSAAPDYLLAALEKSNMAVMTLDIPDSADDPLVLLGGSADGPSLRLELSGGLNGTMDSVSAGTFNGADLGPGRRSGIEAFQEITDVSIMAVPGVTDANVQAKLIAHCEGLTSRFAVLDAPLDCTGVDELNRHRSAYDTTYAALYAPWVQVYDPLLRRPTFLPPSGSMCGIYARTDIQRGVFKAPANEVVQACTGLSVSYNAAEQGKLNPNGVNLIRAIPGQGIRVWGARTCSSDGNWKYINVRRLFIFLEESIRANTGWVVFEPNDEGLWSRVRGTISLFLETQRRIGALAGSTPEQAYYVDVGPNTMTQDDILNGRLICEIGVAPVRPAEFVIFRITQITQAAS
ncbi:MAG: phage tail sheath family protein, partial [Oscillospiraceae bacterium]|nr:phage tail sheath family protein [Oscillospiraceae bacterium]